MTEVYKAPEAELLDRVDNSGDYGSLESAVVEKDMGPMDALSTSRKAIHQKWFSHLGLILVTMIVILVGVLALLIRIVWALPVASLTYALAYRNIFGVEAKTATKN